MILPKKYVTRWLRTTEIDKNIVVYGNFALSYFIYPWQNNFLVIAKGGA